MFLIDVRKALKGLERCARKAVLASVRRAKKLADGQGDGYPAPTASKKSVFDGTHTLSALALGSTAFGKKLTQSKLGSTAFPDGGQQEEGEAGDESTMATHVHRNHRAVGVVFGLALVQRLFSRYSSTDSEDKTQLLVSTRHNCFGLPFLCSLNHVFVLVSSCSTR